MKKLLLSVLAVSAFGVAVAASATPVSSSTAKTIKQFGGNCAMGLALGKEMKTDCKITWTDEASKKVYCFSSEEMKSDFAKDTKGNLEKAEAEFKKHASNTATHTTHKKS